MELSVGSNQNLASSSWTDDTLLIRPILSSDSTASIHPKDRVTGPVLLLQLPENGNGEIYFGAESVVPQWMDLPARLPQLNLSDSTLELPLYIVGADHLPSTGALHYWRWVLLASRLGVEAPKIPIVKLSRSNDIKSVRLYNRVKRLPVFGDAKWGPKPERVGRRLLLLSEIISHDFLP